MIDNKKHNLQNNNEYQIIFDPNNEISINDLIWEIDNSDEFKLYEISDSDSNNEKNILIKIFKN